VPLLSTSFESKMFDEVLSLLCLPPRPVISAGGETAAMALGRLLGDDVRLVLGGRTTTTTALVFLVPDNFLLLVRLKNVSSFLPPPTTLARFLGFFPSAFCLLLCDEVLLLLG